MTNQYSLLKEALENTQIYGDAQHNILFHAPTFFYVPFPVISILLISVILLFNYQNSKVLLKWLGILLGMAITVQSIAQARHFLYLEKVFREKSIVQKKEIVEGKAFRLIDCAEQKLQGRRLSGQFISDIDARHILPREFRYELYPQIDLVSAHSYPQARVCFASRACATGIPGNFQVICSINNGYVALIEQGQGR